MAKSKLVKGNQKIAKAVVGTHKKIKQAVVGSYQSIETGALNGYTKIEDWFVAQYLTKDGETIEDAKKRLVAAKADKQSRTAVQKGGFQ